MIAVWPSRPGFGEQRAEALLATALALPLIFAFAELRGSRLAGTAAAPQLADTQHNSNDAPIAERPSSPVRVILSGRSDGETSIWDSRVALLMEAVKLATRDASESSINSEAEPETNDASEADESVKAPAEGVSPSRRSGRSARPTRTRPAEAPSEPPR